MWCAILLCILPNSRAPRAAPMLPVAAAYCTAPRRRVSARSGPRRAMGDSAAPPRSHVSYGHRTARGHCPYAPECERGRMMDELGVRLAEEGDDRAPPTRPLTMNGKPARFERATSRFDNPLLSARRAYVGQGIGEGRLALYPTELRLPVLLVLLVLRDDGPDGTRTRDFPLRQR